MRGANCKTHLPVKIALLKLVEFIFFARPARGRAHRMNHGSFAATLFQHQNHRFFRVKQFCNWLWLLLLFPILASCLEVQPWFGECLEFHFLGRYSYSWFNKVEHGIPQLTHPFHVNLMYLGLDFSPTPEWSVDTDLQFAESTQEHPFNFRTAAIQGRYLWLDDIVGDPISLTTGASIRATGSSALRDVSCPSHGNVDFEINCSLGKEFDASDDWRFRLWGYAALGHANRGSPWARAIVSAEGNYDDLHKWAVYLDGMNGYGRHTHVYIDHFYGYARIRQKSIDLGLRYGYAIGVYGTLRFEYIRRVLAKSCPENVNTLVVSYLLPFCF